MAHSLETFLGCGLLGIALGLGEAFMVRHLWSRRLEDALFLFLGATVLYFTAGCALGAAALCWERLFKGKKRLHGLVPQPVWFLLPLAFSTLYGIVFLNDTVLPDRPFSDPLSLVWDAAVLLAALVLSLGFSHLMARLSCKWRRIVPGLLLLSCILYSLLGSVSLAPGEAPVLQSQGKQGPNLVLITLDTTRRDFLSLYGHGFDTSPEMDRFAQRCHIFGQATCLIPNTGPGHASLFTSIQPNLLRMGKSNGVPMPDVFTTLAEILKGCGYQTAAVVSGFPLTAMACGLDQGFDAYEDALSAPARLMPLALVAAAVKLADAFGFAPLSLSALERPAEESTDLALRWIERRDQGPFFLWVHYFDPHGPYDPPEPYQHRFGPGQPQGDYSGEIAYMDHHLGRLLRRVEAPDLRQNTLTVITADHGEGLGEHGIIGHSFRLYETDIAVPLLFQVPGLEGPRRHDMPVSLLDVTPTLLELCGISVPDWMMGQSLVGLMKSKEQESTLSGQGSLEVFSETASVRPLCLYSLRRGRYKLIMNAAAGTRDSFYRSLYGDTPLALFDLASDPEERSNLASVNPSLCQELSGRLLAWIASTRDDERLPPPRPSAEVLEKLKALGYAE